MSATIAPVLGEATVDEELRQAIHGGGRAPRR